MDTARQVFRGFGWDAFNFFTRIMELKCIRIFYTSFISLVIFYFIYVINTKIFLV